MSNNTEAMRAALTDAQIDRILSTAIPGGSVASMWFLPHEHSKGLANVRDVVRRMLETAAALSQPVQGEHHKTCATLLDGGLAGACDCHLSTTPQPAPQAEPIGVIEHCDVLPGRHGYEHRFFAQDRFPVGAELFLTPQQATGYDSYAGTVVTTHQAPQPSPRQEAQQVVAWCELTQNGQIAYFDGKPMVMPGPVGNEHHTVPLVRGDTHPAPSGALVEAAGKARDALMKVQGAQLVDGTYADKDCDITLAITAINAALRQQGDTP